MRKVYLASDSQARKKLFRIFGLRFKILPSGIKEQASPRRLSYSQLVKKNAEQKALAVSQKVKSGIIVGADTIVVDGKRIFGKPADIQDARRMLKRLSGSAQWVYTGVCVIDKDKGKKITAFEKTKIYMDKLSDEEISAYFRYVCPLDKAGSFDIQGRGAFFIRRIDGCFYNVVGLPLRKLYWIFKKLHIKVFMLFFILFPLTFILLGGCSPEYNVVTGKQESFYYSTEKEVNMGRSISKQLEKEYKLDGDPLVQERVKNIGRKIVAACDRKDIDYTFKALADDEINAVSLPGGFVYVNKGLIDKVKDDDELAGVLAHEVGHIVARHSIKKLQGVMSYSVFNILTVVTTRSAEVVTAADCAFTELLMGYSREDELLADQLAARYMKLAGYDPHAMISFLEKLQEVNRRKPLRPKTYYKTHPYVPDRIRVVKQELGEKMGFSDYINTEQKTHDQR
ncbi:MAG: Maf family nucleotide pyrophosphatase [Candidatus Omnitrophica bacterium]|nr:Maf family nucleotide pyrophosphatase [Candidatus Omnitrophota bacterium]